MKLVISVASFFGVLQVVYCRLKTDFFLRQFLVFFGLWWFMRFQESLVCKYA